jgi:photosystem II stability/assembly factor-like uncharacterized protein
MRLMVPTFVIALLAAGLALAAPAGATTWSKSIIDPNVPFGDQPTGVSFADRSHGLAVTEDATIYGSSDGGRTWSISRAPASGFTDVPLAVADAGPTAVVAGYSLVDTPSCCSDRAYLASTSDGGASWQLATFAAGSSPDNSRLVGVSHGDAQHYWAVDSQHVFAGGPGVPWVDEALPSPHGPLTAVSFTDDTHGWLVGDQGTILATSDGGAHWTAQVSSTDENLESVSFIDSLHGWASGWDDTVIATSDGGAHWATLQTSSGGPHLDGIVFVDGEHGFLRTGENVPLLNEPDAVFSTSDGGHTWQSAFVPSLGNASGGGLTGLSAVDPYTLWAIGTDTSAGQNDSVVLSGLEPEATLSTSALDFGAQLVNRTSPARTLTVTNTGRSALHMLGLDLAGPGSAFAVVADGCTGVTVDPGSSCPVDVTFDPTSLGPKSSTLIFRDDGINAPQSVALTGTGAQPTAITTPNPLDFGYQPVGVASVRQLTVLNTGGFPLHIAAATLTGATDFAVTSDGCTGLSVAPSSTCTIGLTFRPSMLGSLGATLHLSDDAPDSPQSVALSGIGVAAPVAVLAASPTTGPWPLTTHFDGSASHDTNPNGAIASWTLDFGDGSTPARGSGTPPADIAHTYTAAGSDIATLTVTNSYGVVGAATRTITATSAPTRLSLNPAIARISGLMVYLKASGTLSHATTGAPVVGRTVTFQASGMFVCSAVTDAQGNAGCTGVLPLVRIVLSNGYDGSFGGDGQYLPSAGHAGLVQVN